MRPIIALLLMCSSAFADDDSLYTWKNSNSIAVLNAKPPTTIVLSKVDDKGIVHQATIDFGGEAVTYSGDLPVDESAKVFFDATMKQFRDCK